MILNYYQLALCNCVSMLICTVATFHFRDSLYIWPILKRAEIDYVFDPSFIFVRLSLHFSMFHVILLNPLTERQ